MKNVSDLTIDEINDDIEWMENVMASYDANGQGVSSKEVVRLARLRAEKLMIEGEGLLTTQQIAILQMEYDRIKSIDPSQPTYTKLCATLDAMPDPLLKQISGAGINFMSALAFNRCIRRGI